MGTPNENKERKWLLSTTVYIYIYISNTNQSRFLHDPLLGLPSERSELPMSHSFLSHPV